MGEKKEDIQGKECFDQIILGSCQSASLIQMKLYSKVFEQWKARHCGVVLRGNASHRQVADDVGCNY